MSTTKIKKIKNKAMAFLLVVCMLVGMFAPATVEAYATSSASVEAIKTVSQLQAEAETAYGEATPLNTLKVTSGDYYILSQDWELNSTLVINAKQVVYLDLAGYDITVRGENTVVTVSSGTLVLFDSTAVGDAEGGKIFGGCKTSGLGGSGIFISAGATVDLYDGVNITENKTLSEAYLGAGVYVEGTLNMYGGKISSNTASSNGGGVYNKGTFNLYGGEISGNESGVSNFGAGVYNAKTFNMYGGKISENKSNSGGGGVSNVAQMTMSGGEISSNTASTNGGAIFMGSNSTLLMTGGTIENNKATNSGGAIFMKSSTAKFEMSGGEIVGNASLVGNGVFFKQGEMVVYGSARIFGNGDGGENASNVFVATDRTILVSGELTGKIGVTHQDDKGEKPDGTGEIASAVATGEYEISEATAENFVSDSEEYYRILSNGKIVLAGTGEIPNSTSVSGGDTTIPYSNSAYDVSTMFNTEGFSTADVKYSFVGITGEGEIDGKDLKITKAGTFQVSAVASATINSAKSYGSAILNVEPIEVSVSDIVGISRSPIDGNYYIELQEESGRITGVLDGDSVEIDYSKAYGYIQDEDYANAEYTQEENMTKTFDVVVFGLNLAGEDAQNYILSEEIVNSTVDIVSGFPVIVWPTASDIIYGEAQTDSSLIGGKVLYHVGENYIDITIYGEFFWGSLENGSFKKGTAPTEECVGSQSHIVGFVPNEDAFEDGLSSNEITITKEVILEKLAKRYHNVSYNVDEAAVSFSVTNNVQTVGSVIMPTITARAGNKTLGEEEYEILYFNFVDGAIKYYEAEEITEAGKYLIGSSLSKNYHHSGTVENTAKQIGVLYVVASGESVEKYQTSFGSDATALEGYVGTIHIMPTPTANAQEYIGWQNQKGVFYAFGDRFPQPAYDETFSLVSAPSTHGVSGKVFGKDIDGVEYGESLGDGKSISGITVELMEGSSVLKTTATTQDGYSFDGVEEGNYTIRVSRNCIGLTNIYTVHVVVSGSDAIANITLPQKRQNLVVEIESGLADITIAGIEKIDVSSGGKIEENTVTISVGSVLPTSAEQTEIMALGMQDGYSINNIKLFFDVNFFDQTSNKARGIENLNSYTTEKITLEIPISGIFQGKESYSLYAVQDGKTSAEEVQADWQVDGGMLKITTNQAGVYALAFGDAVEAPLVGTNGEVEYSANAIELSGLFSGLDMNLSNATYEIASQTGEGTISEGKLEATKIGEFEIVVQTAETAEKYSQKATAILKITPKALTIVGVSGVGRGLEQNNIIVGLDYSSARIEGAISGDEVELDFAYGYGAIVESASSSTYYTEYDKADFQTTGEKEFDILILGVNIVGEDSGNYTLATAHSKVKITKSTPYIAWPTAPSITYGQDLTKSTLYGGKYVVYTGTKYVETPFEDCNFAWASETEYETGMGTTQNISELEIGTYYQKVEVTINAQAGIGEDIKYEAYIPFEVKAVAVKFEFESVVASMEDFAIEGYVMDGGEKRKNGDGEEIKVAKEEFQLQYREVSAGEYSTAEPTEVGTYVVSAEFISPEFNTGGTNYHHMGTMDSTGKQIGVLHIVGDVGENPQSYSVKFIVGGEEQADLAIEEAYVEQIHNLPTLSDERYSGWTYDGGEYAFGARFGQPKKDVVFYAQEAPTLYEVSGKITGVQLGASDGSSPEGLSGIGVALYQGSAIVAWATTGVGGEYSFEVQEGNYSLVVSRDQGIQNTITKHIKVSQATNVEEIQLPNITQITKLTVGSGVRAVTVDNMESLVAVGESNVVEVRVDNSSEEYDKDLLLEEASKEDIDKDHMKIFIDISISGKNGTISELDEALTFYIPLEGLYQGYDNYVVYRYHQNADGSNGIDKITTKQSDSQEEWIEFENGDTSTLVLHAKKFSLYGVAFTNQEVSTGGEIYLDAIYTVGGAKEEPTPTEKPQTQEAFSVSYKKNGGSGEVEKTESHQSGATVVVGGQALEKSGYVFAGWKSDADGNVYAIGETFQMPSRDVTLSAHFEKPYHQDVCPLCGACAMPLGICLWVLVAMLAIALAIVIFCAKKKADHNKKQNKNKQQ